MAKSQQAASARDAKLTTRWHLFCRSMHEQRGQSLGLLESVPEPLITIFRPSALPCICANRAFFKHGGWDPDTARLSDVIEIPLLSALQDGKSDLKVEYLYRHRSGCVETFLLVMHPFTTTGPSSGYFCSCVFNDGAAPAPPTGITDWRQILFEYEPNLVMGVEPDFEKRDVRFWFFNRNWLYRLRFPALEAGLGKFGQEAGFPPEELEWWLGNYERMMAQGVRQLKTERKVDRGDSTAFVIRTTIQHLSGWDPPRFLLFAEDITELRELEDKVSKQQERLEETKKEVALLQRFFEEAPVIMGVVDLEEDDFVHLLSNKKPGGYLLVVCLPPADLARWVAELWQAKAENAVRQFEWESTVPALGKGCWYSVLVSCFSEQRCLYVMRDITLKRRAECVLMEQAKELEQAVAVRTQQLEEALQVKSRFLATMSHEIRTPLAGILGSVSLLLEADNQYNTQQQQLLHLTQVCSEQLLSLIGDILDVSRLEEHKVQLETIPFSLLELLHDSLEMVSFGLSEERKLELELIYDADDRSLPNRVIGDQRRIRQIVLNLLQNAVKFTAAGEVVLSATATAVDDKRHELTISVRDTGSGMSDDVKEKIFQPFTQGDSSVTRKYGGSGLGLYICRRLLDLIERGSMWFETQIGVGTTFFVRFVLPIVEAVQPAAGSPELELATRLVVVEPNATSRTILHKKLQRKGFVATAAFSSLSVALASCAGATVLVDAKEYQPSLEEAKPARVILMGYDPPHLPVCYLRKPIRDCHLWHLLSGADAAACARPPPPLGSKREASLHPERILIVEDNRSNQLIIRKLLESLGYRNVSLAENGLEAVNTVKQSAPFDIILMDLMMPVLGGIEAAHQIFDMQLVPRPRIIALTANALPEQREECLRAGIDGYLIKPVRLESLRSALQTDVSSAS